MTKVLRKTRGTMLCVVIWLVACAIPRVHARSDNNSDKPAEKLYLQLQQVGLDPARVYKVRDASLTRSAVQISLEDGTLAFTQDVMGRITGAFFEGDGEVLLTPPNHVERSSMTLFTGMAILEEHFATAYFRFNDDSANELRPGLRAPENPQDFVDRWSTTASNLAQADAMRLLVSFSRMLPVSGGSSVAADPAQQGNDRFLHTRLQGTKLGIFDIYLDSLSTEQVQVGQTKTSESGVTYYDVWASFSPLGEDLKLDTEKVRAEPLLVHDYKIATEVKPPTEIHARARLQIEAKEEGTRTWLFELSRFLQIESVKLDGQLVEFIHNPAVEGTQLARRGNDVVAVILPRPAQAGQRVALEFIYGGEVLAEAGSGLLYVGARGTWYPNRGLSMANFDLTFKYPQDWMLVATGKSTPMGDTDEKIKEEGEKMGRWVSERRIPVAGFNLGKYKMATAQAGNIVVETYATPGVERDFPNSRAELLAPELPSRRPPPPQPPPVILPARPSPARNEVTVGETAARAIEYYAERFGPYPYSHLALTQLPGRDSQGWPGLIFLSSYAFLDEHEREQLHFDALQNLMQQIIPAHETAHQWWGDLINWSSYRDQWFSEGLANYCALMILQEKDPAGFRAVMNKYRQDLLAENKDGVAPKDAGPVTLGGRLLSSRLPEGYEAISYGRGTWLFHMLRTMLKDGSREGTHRGQATTGQEEPFVRALRRLRQRYEGQSISTRELLSVFAEDLPKPLRYEGQASLDWFLDGWVNGTAMPKLELRGVKFTPKGAETEVAGTILQKDASENLVTSVPVYAVLGGKQAPVWVGRVFADGEESAFHLSAPSGTRKIILDPNQTVLTDPR